MDAEDFAWIVARNDAGVIDKDHPDYSFWAETYELEEALASGEPHPDLAKSAEPPPMPQQPQQPEVPSVALALSVEVAAAALSVSVDYFDKHVKPGLRTVNRGRRVLVPVRELERWLDEHAAFALRGSR